jgi:hypothetical protein
MTYSIFDEISALSGADGLTMHTKLVELGIAQIFDYPWHKHHPAGNFTAIVLYTAHTYSWETRMVRIGADWQQTKIRIAQKVELPQYLYDEVVHLKDQMLAECFNEFLHLYHENMDYVHLTSLKDLYQQIMSQSTRFQPDEEGNSDLGAKFKNIQRATELKEQIKAIEDEVTARYRILRAPKSDFKYDNTEHGNPLKVENSRLIRGR